MADPPPWHRGTCKTETPLPPRLRPPFQVHRPDLLQPWRRAVAPPDNAAAPALTAPPSKGATDLGSSRYSALNDHRRNERAKDDPAPNHRSCQNRLESVNITDRRATLVRLRDR